MERLSVLALNETRKTLLASRLLRADRSDLSRLCGSLQILPGDGVWIENCAQVNTMGMPVPLDLLFLDADHRVVGKIVRLPAGALSPPVSGATEVLELPPGTILSTHTEVGDRILIEMITPKRTVS